MAIGQTGLDWEFQIEILMKSMLCNRIFHSKIRKKVDRDQLRILVLAH